MHATIGDNIPRHEGYFSQAPASRVISAIGTSELMGTGLMTGTSSGAQGVGPIAVLGKPENPMVAVLIIGDSIISGRADNVTFDGSNGGGYAFRAMYQPDGSNVLANSRLHRHGSQISVYRLHGARRRLLYPYATHAIMGFGANDLFGPNDPVPSFLSNFDAEISDLKAANLHVTISSVAPRTDSTDNWQTLSGQTNQPNWSSTTIDQVTTALLTRLDQGDFDDYFNCNALWGVNGDHRQWVVNGTTNYPTSDGAHPSGTLHALAGEALKALTKTFTPVGGGLYQQLESETKILLGNTLFPEPAYIEAYDTLIQSGKNDGWWAHLDGLWLLAAQFEQLAKLNIKDPQNYQLTEFGMLSFTRNEGYSGDGSSGYFDTGFNPDLAGGLYAQNSSHAGVWSATNSGDDGCAMGAIDSTAPQGHLYLRTRRPAPDIFQSNVNDTSYSGTTIMEGLGHFLATRTNASDYQKFHNGIQVDSTNNASTSPPNNNVHLLNWGGQSAFSSQKISIAHIGGGLSAAQASNLYNALSNYLAKLSAL